MAAPPEWHLLGQPSRARWASRLICSPVITSSYGQDNDRSEHEEGKHRSESGPEQTATRADHLRCADCGACGHGEHKRRTVPLDASKVGDALAPAAKSVATSLVVVGLRWYRGAVTAAIRRLPVVGSHVVRFPPASSLKRGIERTSCFLGLIWLSGLWLFCVPWSVVIGYLCHFSNSFELGEVPRHHTRPNNGPKERDATR
jgi:hypothetical protein